MKKKDLLCSQEEATDIWEKALESAQDVPGDAGENEAIYFMQTSINKILKDRFNILNQDIICSAKKYHQTQKEKY